MNRVAHPRRRTAFTLVEVMVAVLILALMSTGAALVFSHPLNEARFADARRAVQRFDASARQAATISGRRVRLAFDFGDNAMIRREGAELAQVTARVTLPSGVRVIDLRVCGGATNVGEAVVDVSPLGLTRTYAVHLSGPAQDQWLLIAGLTGEATPMRDEKQLDAIDRE